MLVTIIAGSGSAPRGAGAVMAVGKEGRLAGTIGGGMLEFQATETAREYLKGGRTERSGTCCLKVKPQTWR